MLTSIDREEISRGMAEGLLYKEIGVRIGRDPSIVSREVARHGGRAGYRAVAAGTAAAAARGWPKLFAVERSPELRTVVIERLREGLHRALVGKGEHMPKKKFDRLRRAVREQLVSPDHYKWFNSVMAHANDFDLDRRLRDLAAELGDLAYFLVGGDVGRWVTAVKKARNSLTHLDEAQRKFDGADLLWLAESMFYVTTLCLLLHTGLKPERLPGIMRHIDRWNDVGRLEGVVDRVAGELPRA
ncbi:HEPN domain-containing protein [Winogradskya consettensis]|nr:HEPN domain-containing protein [Actinoplanes consettensis]